MAEFKLSQEKLDQLHEFYMTNDITLEQLARASKEIVGESVPLASIQYYSNKFRWGVQKRRVMNGKSAIPTGMADEADDLRAIIYATIMNPEADLTPQGLAQLIGAYDKLKDVAPKNQSAKTSRQLQIERTRRGVRKVEEQKSRTTRPASK